MREEKNKKNFWLIWKGTLGWIGSVSRKEKEDFQRAKGNARCRKKSERRIKPLEEISAKTELHAKEGGRSPEMFFPHTRRKSGGEGGEDAWEEEDRKVQLTLPRNKHGRGRKGESPFHRPGSTRIIG